jgi:hypothetical protein
MTSLQPVVVTFRPLTASQRWRHYLRVLRRPRILVPFLVVGLLPAGIDRAVALLMPSPRFSLALVARGLGFVLAALVLFFVASEGVAAIRRLLGSDEGSIVFHDQGIRETRGGRETRHGWDWIAEAWETDGILVLACNQPMRSFRLSRGSQRHLLVEERAGADRLEQLLDAHRPGLLRKNRA